MASIKASQHAQNTDPWGGRVTTAEDNIMFHSYKVKNRNVRPSWALAHWNWRVREKYHLVFFQTPLPGWQEWNQVWSAAVAHLHQNVFLQMVFFSSLNNKPCPPTELPFTVCFYINSSSCCMRKFQEIIIINIPTTLSGTNTHVLVKVSKITVSLLWYLMWTSFLL